MADRFSVNQESGIRPEFDELSDRRRRVDETGQPGAGMGKPEEDQMSLPFAPDSSG
jgi:hypothetical protein